MNRLALLAALLLLGLVVPAAVAQRPDRGRWPANSRMILMQNEEDQNRPLDGRTGYSPFGSEAPSSACNEKCESHLVPCEGENCAAGERMWDGRTRYLKLLGGHGDDDIHGGPFVDVLWADFKPSGQPAGQVDRVDGGAGRDYIYGSAGRNTLIGGPGDDYIVARFMRGSIDCGPGKDTVYVSKASRAASKITGCETITRGPLR